MWVSIQRPVALTWTLHLQLALRKVPYEAQKMTQPLLWQAAFLTQGWGPCLWVMLLSSSQGTTLGRRHRLSGPEFPLLQNRDMISKWAESLAERCYRRYRELSSPGPGPKHTATWRRAVPSKDPGSGTQAKNRLDLFSVEVAGSVLLLHAVLSPL